MQRYNKSWALTTALLFFLVTWIVDPAFVGLVGQEGLFRWGALLAIVVLALTTRAAWRFFDSRTFLLQAVFVVAALVSAFAANSDAGYLEALRLAPVCLAVPLISEIAAAGKRDQFKSLLVGTLMAITTLSIISGYVGGRLLEGRLYGVSWHPNALTLSAATLCSICLLSPPPSRVWSIACFLAGGWAVVLSDSLLGIVMVGTVAAASLVRGWLGPRSAVVVLVTVAAVLIASPLVVVTVVADNVSWFGLVDLSTFQRLVIWRNAAQDFLAQPLLGTGFADGQSVYDFRSLVTVNYSHSVILTYLRTTGLIGFTAIAALIIHVTLRSVRSTSTGDLSSIAILFPALAMSSVEAGLQQMPLSWILFWIAAGLAPRLTNRRTSIAARSTATLAVAD
jgi:hypothetical protein